MAALAKVLEEVLALPVERRNDLVEFLNETITLPPEEQEQRIKAFMKVLEETEEDDLENETTPEWRAAWGAEIRRRQQAVAEGRSRLIPHEEVMAELRARFRR